jgi:hypothetical protein
MRKEMAPMFRLLTSFLALMVLALQGSQATAQLARNPKLSPQDFAAAQADTREAGGDTAELIYAARIDAVERGRLDSLVVIYAKPAKGGKDYFALVSRDGKKYRLSFDQSGRALKSGDQFLRIGLRHEEGKSPLLRLMGSTTEPGKPGEWQRSLDFQFNGSEFTLVGQSMMPIAK